MAHDTARDAPVVGHVSITRCAQLLAEAGDAVDRSALSRYCDTHGLKLGGAGRETLVDFEAVRAHRAASYSREVMSGRPVTAAPLLAVVPSNVTPLDPNKRRAAAQAMDAELDLAERLGELTAVAEVDAGVADAIVEMRSAFVGALQPEAERLAAELALPPERIRALRAGLKRYARAGQERFAQSVARSLAMANEPSSEATRRLAALSATALRLRVRPETIEAARA